MSESPANPGPDRAHLALALEAAGLGEFEWRQADDVFILSPRAAAILGHQTGLDAPMSSEAFYSTVPPGERRNVFANCGITGHIVDCDAVAMAEVQRVEPLGKALLFGQGQSVEIRTDIEYEIGTFDDRLPGAVE